jgi:hypothetical protein
MSNFLVRVSNLINLSVSKFIRWVLVFLRSRHLFSAWKIYVMSDEINKYLHIKEAINYLRVAGANDRPHTYFKLGCHSGRTFSTFSQSLFIKMK